MVRRSFTLF